MDGSLATARPQHLVDAGLVAFAGRAQPLEQVVVEAILRASPAMNSIVPHGDFEAMLA
jgi:hypothetical protein